MIDAAYNGRIHAVTRNMQRQRNEQAADRTGAGGEKPPRIHRGAIFTIVAAALIMSTLDATIVATALDTLQRDLDTTINWAGWTITAYAFGLVLMLPLSGKLSTQYGHRRMFLASVFVFSAASLACGFATNIYMLIVLRVIQAAGGAGFTPSATAIIVEYFGRARDRAVGVFGSLFATGAMTGPIFGGLLVAYWSWRGIFWINVPIGAAVIALALHYIPRDPLRSEKPGGRADIPGMVLLGFGLLAGMFTITYLGEKDARLASASFLVPLVVAIIAFSAFFRHVHRTAAPFIAPRLIHGRGFGAVNLVNALYTGIPIGMVALIPIYAAHRYGIDPLRAGTLLAAQGAANILLVLLGAALIRRTGYRLPIYVGGAIIALGLVLLWLGPEGGIPPYAWLAGSAFLAGAGAGTLSPPSRNAGLQLAPRDASTIAALRTMCINTGAITTVSVVTALVASFGHPGSTQAWTYLGAAVILVAALPLVSRIPEHRGAW